MGSVLNPSGCSLATSLCCSLGQRCVHGSFRESFPKKVGIENDRTWETQSQESTISSHIIAFLTNQS